MAHNGAKITIACRILRHKRAIFEHSHPPCPIILLYKLYELYELYKLYKLVEMGGSRYFYVCYLIFVNLWLG